MPDPWLKTKKYKGMKYINRNSLLVRKKQPFVDWVNYMDALHSSPDSIMDFTLESVNHECKVYLIDPIELMEVTRDYIEMLKPRIFEAELCGYFNKLTIENWPEDRSAKVFDEWFEIEFHSMVIDMEKLKLKREKDDVVY